MAHKMPVKDGMPPIHPGEFLKELLEELQLSQTGLADALGISAMRVSLCSEGSDR